MQDASICGLGQTAPAAVRSALTLGLDAATPRASAPRPGSRACPTSRAGRHPEADAHGAPVPGTDTDGPDVGERAAEYREADAGPVGPTAVDPVAPTDRLRSSRSRRAGDARSIARMLTLTVDGAEVRVPEGATILDALQTGRRRADTPTLCWAPNLTPINACRVCMVEVEGSRVLVPSCARKVEDGMVVRTDSEKVRHSRRMVLELLASSVDLSQASADVQRWMREYGVDAAALRPARPARRPTATPATRATTTPPTGPPRRPSRSR